LDLTEDICSVTDLKRYTREILDHIHATGRPVVLTVNGRADAVLLDSAVYQKQLQAACLARFLAPAEAEVSDGSTRSATVFLEEFKRVRNIQS